MEKTTLADKYLTFSEESKKSLHPKAVELLIDTFNKVYPGICDFFNNGEIRHVVFETDSNCVNPHHIMVVEDDRLITGNIIKFNPNNQIFQKQPYDIDFMTHELVHVAQPDKYWHNDNYPMWITEGLADYGREKFGLNNKATGWSITKVTGKKSKRLYEQGYTIAAGFFIWIEKNIDETLPKDLNEAMKSGRYSRNYFIEKTGKTIDELWEVYLDASILEHLAWIESEFDIKVPENLNSRIISGSLNDNDENYFTVKAGKTLDELWEAYVNANG